MDAEECDSWVPPKTSEEEAIDLSRKAAISDTMRWIEEMCEKKCANQIDFRESLRNGVLLCEVLNRLKPGCVKRINRRPTPIAGLDNLSVFLATLERDFGFSKSQLFDVKDLEDISEKYQGDALAKEEESRALRVAVALCCLSENFISRDVISGSFVTDVSGAVVKPIDSTLFIAGTVIHRRQSLALSTDSDSLASSSYLTASSMPVRHNYDSGAGTSFDSLDDNRTSSAASGGSARFQKRDARDLAKEAERQMEVARINRTMASSIRTNEPNDDEWRSNLSDWREKRRRQQAGSLSFDQADSIEKDEPAPSIEDSDYPKPFRKMVEESNRRRRSYNLLYPVEDEEPVVCNIDIPDQPSTPSTQQSSSISDRTFPSSTSYPDRAAWAQNDSEDNIKPQIVTKVHSTPQVPFNSSQNVSRETNGKVNQATRREYHTSESCSSDDEMIPQRAAGRQRTTTIRLNKRQGRTELYFGIQLCTKSGSIVVDRIVRGSTADINEVQVGDKVVSIDGQSVASVAEAKKRLDGNSAQLCVLRTNDEDEFSEDLSDDDSVELRHTQRQPPSYRRSAPSMVNRGETKEICAGPPSTLPLLRQASSSSSASHNDEAVSSELNKIADESTQDTPMINGLLNAAKKGELTVDVEPDGSEDESSLTPTAADPPSSINDKSPNSSLSVKQRISTIESRNSFFGVKADSEEKKYKEIEETSSRPLSGSGDDSSSDKKSLPSQALPWQRNQEFRPIRPRLGNYQKAADEEVKVNLRTPTEVLEPQRTDDKDDGAESDDATQLFEGMSQMRDDMAKWRQKQETNELEIECVLSQNRSGPSSSSSHRSRDSGDELPIKKVINVKEKEVIPSAAEDIDSAPLSPELPAGPPVRDSRARHAQQPSQDSADSSALHRVLDDHAEAVKVEIQKLEQLQFETTKPNRSSHEPTRQTNNSNSSFEARSSYSDGIRRSQSNEGSTSNKGFDYNQEIDDEEQQALRQPYLQKYLVGDFKNQQQNRFVVPKTTPSASPPSYAEVKSRNSSRNKENIPNDREKVRPKSLVTDQPSTAKHGPNSSEFNTTVRSSTSDTQLVSSTQVAKSPPKTVPYYQPQVEEEQLIKPSYKQTQHQAPPGEVEKPKTDVMSRSAYEFQTSRPAYEQPQQVRYTSTLQHKSPQYSNNDHYNQIYGEQPQVRYNSTQQQQISPKAEQYYTSPRTESQPSEVSPMMSTSLYDFNRSPRPEIDENALHLSLNRSQNSLNPYQNTVVQHQRHTIQKPASASSTSTRMPNSHSVDSGLYQMRAQKQFAAPPAVSNPVYSSGMMHEPKRASTHNTPAQRHWLVDEALRRQQAEMQAQRRQNSEENRRQAEIEAQRRQQAELEAQRRQQAELEAQRRQQAEIEAQRRQQAELEAQRRQQAEMEAQRRQQAELEAQRRHKAETERRKGPTSMIALKHAAPLHGSPAVSEIPPALPPRMKSSAAMAAMQRPRPVLNSRAPCCACNQALGTGDLMTIESLHLSFHLTCFRCIVCQTMLGSGRQDADVRVRGSRLYCFNCSALEEGSAGGGAKLGRRGGGRY